MVLNDLVRVSGRFECRILQLLAVREEEVRVAGALHRWRRQVEDIPCDFVALKHNVYERVKHHQALSVHSALLLHNLAKESVLDALETTSLIGDVVVADQFAGIGSILHLLIGSCAEFDFRLQLRDAEDPLSAFFLEGIFDLQEVSNLPE